MADILLHNEKANSNTYVSNTFIDHYMTTANGEYVKIYLYLLRCLNTPGCSFSISKAADTFEHTEKDIQRALMYWEKMNLLRLEYNTEKALSGIYFTESQDSDKKTIPPPTAAPSDTGIQTNNIPATKEKPKRHTYTASELAAFQEKDNVKELLFVTEHYLKRPLTVTDIHTILYWYDELKHSVELIEYLIEYCLGKGHTSLRYMDKVAGNWMEEGIKTIEQAKQNNSSYSQNHFAIMKAFGIRGRNLTSSETDFINKWVKRYGFTQDIISEACRRTMASIHQPSFEYADGILERWHNSNIKHLSDIAQQDTTYQRSKNKTTTEKSSRAKAPVSSNKFNNFPQRSYDYDKLEELLLNSQRSKETSCH